MFCPIDAKANCTNATLCVVMCPTEKDLMQQGNHRTGKCEKGNYGCSCLLELVHMYIVATYMCMHICTIIKTS